MLNFNVVSQPDSFLHCASIQTRRGFQGLMLRIVIEVLPADYQGRLVLLFLKYTVSFRSFSYLSPGQTDSQVDASRPKFAKPELAYGLAKGGQTTRKSACKSQKTVNFTHIIG